MTPADDSLQLEARSFAEPLDAVTLQAQGGRGTCLLSTNYKDLTLSSRERTPGMAIVQNGALLNTLTVRGKESYGGEPKSTHIDAFDELLDELAKDPNHPEWAYIIETLDACEHIPPTTFNVLQRLVKNPEACALILLLNPDKCQAYLERLTNLPFLLHAIPAKAWTRASRRWEETLTGLPGKLANECYNRTLKPWTLDPYLLTVEACIRERLLRAMELEQKKICFRAIQRQP